MCAQNQAAVEKMLMLLASGYFDESTDAVEERCFTVAGYVGWQHHALHLDMKWKSLLNHWGLEYFKASQIQSGMGAFRHLRDNPKNITKPLSPREKKLIIDVVSSFIDLICESEMVGIAATVLMRDLYTFKECEPELANKIPSPYQLCGQLLMVDAADMILDHNSRTRNFESCALLRPVFDSHNYYANPFKQAFPIFKQLNPMTGSVTLEPIYETEQTYRCLQAADLLAFQARKQVEGYAFNDEWQSRVAMDRLISSTRNIYYIDYDALKFLATTSSPDRIAISPKKVADNQFNIKIKSRRSGWAVGRAED